MSFNLVNEKTSNCATSKEKLLIASHAKKIIKFKNFNENLIRQDVPKKLRMTKWLGEFGINENYLHRLPQLVAHRQRLD